MAKRRNRKKKRRRKSRSARKAPAKQLPLFENGQAKIPPAPTEAAAAAEPASSPKAVEEADAPSLFPAAAEESATTDAPEPAPPDAPVPAEPSVSHETHALPEPAPAGRRSHAEDRGAVRPAAVAARRAAPAGVRLDRTLLALVMGVLAFWLADTVLIWGWALDSSGATTLQIVVASLAALAAASALSRRWGARMIAWTRLTAFLGPGAKDKPRESGPALWPARVAGLAAAWAALGGVLTTAAAWGVGRWLIDSLTDRMLWTPLGWAGLKLLVVFVGTLPLALAWSGAVAAGRCIQPLEGADGPPAVRARRMWGLAGGLAAFALLWWCGVAVEGTALFAGVLLIALAVLLLQRPVEEAEATPRAAFGQLPRRRARLAGVAEFGLVGLLLAVQCRLLQDTVGATMAGQALWLAATAALVGVMRRRAVATSSGSDCPVFAPGVLIGLLATVVLQIVLCLTALGVRAGWASDSWSLLVFAALAQIPFSWFAAAMASRRESERVSPSPGGPPAGLALGVAVYLAAVGSPAGRAVLLAGVAVSITVCLAWWYRAVRETWKKQVILASGVVLALSLAGMVWLSVGAAGISRMGRWLTWLAGPGARPDSSCGQGAMYDERWQSEFVTDCVRQILSNEKHRGVCWAAVSHESDLEALAAGGVQFVRCGADPAVIAPPPEGEGDVPGADFFRILATGRRRFDSVLLSLLPADHPQARRAYSRAILKRVAGLRIRSSRGVGLIVVRTQTARDRLADAVALARTLESVVTSGRVILERGPKRYDLLLVAPASAFTANVPPSPQRVACSLEQFCVWAGAGEPRRLLSPRPFWRHRAADWDDLVSRASSR